jgi:hypothetical protein
VARTGSLAAEWIAELKNWPPGRRTSSTAGTSKARARTFPISIHPAPDDGHPDAMNTVRND